VHAPEFMPHTLDILNALGLSASRFCIIMQSAGVAAKKLIYVRTKRRTQSGVRLLHSGVQKPRAGTPATRNYQFKLSVRSHASFVSMAATTGG
jgi:hypothetical protein